jgi:hypothetical protein
MESPRVRLEMRNGSGERVAIVEGEPLLRIGGFIFAQSGFAGSSLFFS